MSLLHLSSNGRKTAHVGSTRAEKHVDCDHIIDDTSHSELDPVT